MSLSPAFMHLLKQHAEATEMLERLEKHAGAATVAQVNALSRGFDEAYARDREFLTPDENLRAHMLSQVFSALRLKAALAQRS